MQENSPTILYIRTVFGGGMSAIRQDIESIHPSLAWISTGMLTHAGCPLWQRRPGC
ncbi:hypothetical protein bAD24_p01445 (plasmid) [Burkholderia sp. AD24]|nr:hypothetical protein bAD24_p01445 [Burkholderia sp. AD24]